jgi:hypothetical protein
VRFGADSWRLRVGRKCAAQNRSGRYTQQSFDRLIFLHVGFLERVLIGTKSSQQAVYRRQLDGSAPLQPGKIRR